MCVAHFLEEVRSSDFLTGVELAEWIGLKTGIPIKDAGWLRYTLDGREVLISKQPLRFGVSWLDLL